tara:strand:- start:86 stop:1303 length:1218 start_codon:yes stop_codon:yes gene_type:complete
MFTKRSRIFTSFSFLNLLHLFKTVFSNKKNFEYNLKDFIGKKNISLTSQGRVALFDIVKLIVTKEKNEIILSPYTLPEVVYAIIYAGGKPKYLDIDIETGLVEAKILSESINGKTAAVLITHLYSNTKNILNFVEKFNGKIKIIEDAAINFGSKVNGKFLGTLADYGFFSFNIVKNLNTLNGGAIYIKKDEEFKNYIKSRAKIRFPLKETLKLLITTFIIKIFFNNISFQFTYYLIKYVYDNNIKFIMKKIYPVIFHEFHKNIPKHYTYDFNFLMDHVGCFKLRKVNEDFELRMKKVNLYKKFLEEKNIKHFRFENIGENSFLEYPVLLKKTSNKKMHTFLFKKGLDIRHTWYINNAKKIDNYEPRLFNNTEIIEDKIFCLPVHPNIKEKDILRICSLVNMYENE